LTRIKITRGGKDANYIDLPEKGGDRDCWVFTLESEMRKGVRGEKQEMKNPQETNRTGALKEEKNAFSANKCWDERGKKTRGRAREAREKKDQPRVAESERKL